MDQIVPFELERMLWGTTPPLFYLEIATRVVVIWMWTVVLLRWIGGRSISQMSVVEFLLVIALGSAVGDAMFYPEVPLFHAMLVIFMVVLADKCVDLAFRKWSRAKRLVDGTPIEVVRNGIVLTSGLDKHGIGATEVKELLRLKGVRNLGQVEFAFMEPSGSLSVFALARPRPGLPIVPPRELCKDAPPDLGATLCCSNCGTLVESHGCTCPDCGKTRQVAAREAEPLTTAG